MCRLVNMNVLSTIDVDSLATVRAHYKVTGVKSHRLCLTIRVIPFYPFLNKYSGPFEPVNQFFFVFLLNLWESFDSLPPLLFQKDVLGVCHLHEFLSRVEATRERILVDNESQLWLLQGHSTLMLVILVIYDPSWCLPISTQSWSWSVIVGLDSSSFLLVVRFISDHVLLVRMLVVPPRLCIDRILFELLILIFLQLLAVFNSLSRYPLLVESVLLRGEEVIV